MTRVTAKLIALATMRPTRLHKSYDGLECFMVHPVVKTDYGLHLIGIPFVNEPGVVERVLEVERGADFITWGKNPFTGQILACFGDGIALRLSA